MKVIISRHMATLHPLSPATPTPVYVCRGKDCRKKSKKLACLESTISEHGEVIPVACQKICKGPVAGLELNGRLEWFSKLDEKSARKGFAHLLSEGQLKEKLKDRIAKKRRGKFRGSLQIAAK